MKQAVTELEQTRKAKSRSGLPRPREICVAGQPVQVDVKHLECASGRLYRFTAIDEVIPNPLDHYTSSLRSSNHGCSFP